MEEINRIYSVRYAVLSLVRQKKRITHNKWMMSGSWRRVRGCVEEITAVVVVVQQAGCGQEKSRPARA